MAPVKLLVPWNNRLPQLEVAIINPDAFVLFPRSVIEPAPVGASDPKYRQFGKTRQNNRSRGDTLAGPLAGRYDGAGATISNEGRR